MKLKYFKQGTNSFNKKVSGIYIDRILSITKIDYGIRFMEDCDRCFDEKYTKEDAIELLMEAIDWIKEGC